MNRDFFLQPTLVVARQLLGCVLTSRNNEGETAGQIVETEAYLGSNDPASHSHRGLTKRNQAMFGQPGTIYVYFTYGMHLCLNLVTGSPGVGEAVLIRALEPLQGLSLMRHRRRREDIHDLCSGPAKLAQALGITLADNSVSLNEDRFSLKLGEVQSSQKIITAPRIGIRQAEKLPYRFYYANNSFVSK